MNPLVTIAIPTYNGAAYLEEALQSIEHQTYSPIEVVVSDDMSSDATLRIVRDFFATRDFEVTIESHLPQGIGANWNNCVKLAKGKYLKFLFQDDVLKPDCVEKMVALAEEDDDIGLVFSNRELIGNEVMKSEQDFYQPNYPAIFDGRDILQRKDFYAQPRNKIGEPTSVLVRKDIFEYVGYFDEYLKQALDYEFWYRVCGKAKIGFIPESLAEFRVHENQTTAQNSSQILKDRVRLPYLLLKRHFLTLHFKMSLILFYKMLSGAIAYVGRNFLISRHGINDR